MLKLQTKWLSLAAGALLASASAAFAQDNGPLIDLLVKKGLVNDQEAEELRAELTRDNSAGIISTISGGKSTVGLSISGRLQVQYAGLGTDIDGAATQPASTNHFFLRRMYLGVKANLGNNWSSTFNYDFAGTTFDQAFITWRQSDAFSVDVGFRKVPFGLEEWYISSGSLKAIERSPVTRYFVESNNGRRLGAGSYRIGVFAGGKLDNGFFYNAAVTNPERNEDGTSGVTSAGSAANNSPAYWGNVGYTHKIGEGTTYTVAGSMGVLPDQGGPSNTGLGKGDDLSVYSLWGTLAHGPFELAAEYFLSDNDHGVSATQDSNAKGYWVQPSYKLSEKFEATVRYTAVYAGRRGVNLSDGIRSAPGGGTMKEMNEWYIGGTYFFRGNDAKLQLGYIHGESKDTVSGGKAKATTDGVRSQMQVNF